MAVTRIVVLVDGTWCGTDANTESNINYLARMIGVSPTANDPTYTSTTENIHAKYFNGVGLGGDFLSYLWDGAFATHAKEDCTEVYKYIVQNYTSGCEIWMFGISRGAYTVRSVAGMINNCGIIKERDNTEMIEQVYDVYRSPYPVNEPSSLDMENFRRSASYDVKTPIKFMGLFDTVGARGIPKLDYDSGTGFEWPEFHDNLVSSVVEKVYHALAMHDRLWAFQPCMASRHLKHAGRHDLRIYQTWFPGTHYDLARQEFQCFRERRKGLEGMISFIINKLSYTVFPNNQLADLVLLWMLEKIAFEGGGSIIKQNEKSEAMSIVDIVKVLRASLPEGSTGTGDMYGDIFRYLPLGKIIKFPRFVQLIKPTLYKAIINPKNRVIPELGNPMNDLVQNEVYNYTVEDSRLGTSIVGITAQVGGRKEQNQRYPSRTFQDHIVYMEGTGRTV
ncbi:hypothetical protein H2198_004091 [Neophaeococcomyces mojaviensis]|uniref:Uncharacterized protein n=1 Tax=Neophaeococcomyces mojaviensis TaxID=3383035 RepID=A0ACC3A9H5_9EURO|nr:hypothetical protein H2198_004091 [Knufia sp. JES_112]